MQISANQQRKVAQRQLSRQSSAPPSRQDIAEAAPSTTGSALFFVDSCTERQLLGIHKRATSTGSGTGMGAGDVRLKPVDEAKEDAGALTGARIDAVDQLQSESSVPQPILTSLSMNAAELSSAVEGFISPTPQRALPLIVDSAPIDTDESPEGVESGPAFLFSDVQSEPTRSPPVIVPDDSDESQEAATPRVLGHRHSASTGDISELNEPMVEFAVSLDLAPKQKRNQSYQDRLDVDNSKPLSRQKQYGSEPQLLGKGKTPVIAKLYANIKRGATAASCGPSSPISSDASFVSAEPSRLSRGPHRGLITPADSIDAGGYFLGDNDVDAASSEGDALSPSRSWRGPAGKLSDRDLLLDEDERLASRISSGSAAMGQGMKKAVSLDQILTVFPREDEFTPPSCTTSDINQRSDSNGDGGASASMTSAGRGEAGLTTPLAPSPMRSASMRRSKDTSHMRKSSHKSNSGTRGLSETVWSILRQQVCFVNTCC
jgi:hypothetical protein